MRQWSIFIGRRLVLMIVSLWFLATVTFLLVTLTPSDPARTLAGPYANSQQVAAVAQRLGLNLSLGMRYADYLKGLVHGNLGESFFSPNSVASLIWSYLPSTLELIILGMVVGLVLGLFFGVVSAYFHRRWPDRLASGLVGVFQSIPDFALGVLLLYLLSYLAGALPGPSGQLSIADPTPPHVTGMILLDSLISGRMDTFQDAFNHALLPVLTLGLVISALFARISRAALREALESGQTTFARACGLSEPRVVWYAFISSRTPVMTYTAMVFGALFGGTAIVETIFNWNGLSQWAVQSMVRSDYPSIEGFVLFVGVITLLVYVVLDVFTAILDPRVRAVYVH